MKLLASAFVAILALSGCQSAYYAAWEKWALKSVIS